jgi:single-stranded-DNA-specific exonuclease
MDTLRSQDWRYRKEDIGLADLISKRLEIHPVLARILVARSIMEPDEAYDLLHPSLRKLHDPFLFNTMEGAVNRISRAVSEGEGLTIHGDYDVDGITSTALLKLVLNEVVEPGRLNHYLPSRFGDGYGLSPKCIKEMDERGDSLLITVDCGIKAIDEVKMANEKGIDVVVTDHHEPGNELPASHSIIDPKVMDSGYPFKELAGVGVAFKLATGLQMRGVTERDVRGLIDLVALGTVSDLVELVDENRTLVRYGLQELAKTKHIGLTALMGEAGLEPWKGIRSSDIAFKLGPRLNSAGRLAHPGMALDLILTNDRVDADLFSRELSTLNYKRQAIGKKLVDEIVEQIDLTGQEEAPAVVVGKEGWNPGVIGVSAARVVELTGKPSIILTIEGETARGSARAPKGFNIVEALGSISEILIMHGGHERAAGLTLKADLIDELRERFCGYVDRNYPDHVFIPVIDIDLDLLLSEMDIEAVDSLDKLGPFGMGNSQPLISVREVSIGYDIKAVGSGKHLKFSVTDGHNALSCIWFNMGEYLDQLGPGTMVTLAGLPEIHHWRGEDEVQLRVNDLILHG